MTSNVSVTNFKSRDRARKTFTEALRRNGVAKPGQTATLLLEAFYLQSVTIDSKLVQERGLCGKGKGAFTTWRNNLQKLGFLDWTDVKDTLYATVVYKAGSKTVTCVNRLTSKHLLLASKEDVKKVDERVDRVEDEVKSLKAEVAKMRSALGVVIQNIDPPLDDDKLEFYSSNPDQLGKKRRGARNKRHLGLMKA